MHRLNRTILLAATIGSLCSNGIHAQTSHYIDVWGEAGYSSILHGMDNTHTPGGFGYELGAGYQLEAGKFILQTGAGFMHLHSVTDLTGYSVSHDFSYTDPATGTQHAIPYTYTLDDYRERYSIGYLHVPILAGVRFGRYYALAGVKMGVNLFGSYQASGSLGVTAQDPEFNEPWTGIPEHGTGQQPISSTGSLQFGLSVTPSVEFGVYLDEWLPRGMTQLNNRRRTSISYRIGAFVDYGVLNLNQAATDVSLITRPTGDDPSATHMLHPHMSSLSASSLAQGKRFANLLAGVKLAVQFDVSKKKAKRLSKQQPTTTLPLVARIVDARTGEGVQAEVSVRYTAGNREIYSGPTDINGLIDCGEQRKGRYTVLASAEGYTPYRRMASHFRPDTLFVKLNAIPSFIVQVADAETNLPVTANVMLADTTTQNEVLHLTTDANTGIATAQLNVGWYDMNVTADGYVYQQATVNHVVGDTLYVNLQPVKKDVKVVLHNLFFALNSATILSESTPALDDLYRFLTDNPDVSIFITGHTDNTGSLDYNMKLSAERAKAVYDELVLRGIDPTRITYEGRGPNEPVDTNDTEEGRSTNRRVEFTIL